MKIVPCDRGMVMANSAVFEILMQFSRSNYDCVRVEDYPHASANICAQGLRAGIKKYRLFNIKVTKRGNDVFLIRMKPEKND